MAKRDHRKPLEEKPRKSRLYETPEVLPPQEDQSIASELAMPDKPKQEEKPDED